MRAPRGGSVVITFPGSVFEQLGKILADTGYQPPERAVATTQDLVDYYAKEALKKEK